MKKIAGLATLLVSLNVAAQQPRPPPLEEAAAELMFAKGLCTPLSCEDLLPKLSAFSSRSDLTDSWKHSLIQFQIDAFSEFASAMQRRATPDIERRVKDTLSSEYMKHYSDSKLNWHDYHMELAGRAYHAVMERAFEHAREGHGHALIQNFHHLVAAMDFFISKDDAIAASLHGSLRTVMNSYHEQVQKSGKKIDVMQLYTHAATAERLWAQHKEELARGEKKDRAKLASLQNEAAESRKIAKLWVERGAMPSYLE